jgi:hypothetical protein
MSFGGIRHIDGVWSSELAGWPRLPRAAPVALLLSSTVTLAASQLKTQVQLSISVPRAWSGLGILPAWACSDSGLLIRVALAAAQGAAGEWNVTL